MLGLTTEAAIDEVVSYGQSTAAELPDGIDQFVRSYYRLADLEDLAERRAEDLFGAAADHARFAQAWRPGTTVVDVFNPRIDTHGWASPHTVVMIVTDDMPFLVDSVTMVLNRDGLGIHVMMHPIFLDKREAGEGFVDAATASDDGSGLVSLMLVEVDRQSGAEVLAQLQADIEQVLADVRAAVEDWQPMRGQALAIAEELDPDALPMPADEVSEAKELLRFLASDHFTFLGYREYELDIADGEDVLRPVPGSGLGILRQADHDDPSPSFARLPLEARRKAREPRLLNLTKANSKATVHRPVFLDYVGVKTFDEAGNVTGERRFLGLYASTVYSQSVTEIPLVRRLAANMLSRSDLVPGSHAEKDLLTIMESYPRDELFQVDPDDFFETAMGILHLQERRRVRVFVREDRFGRFVTALVFLPRDRYNTEARLGTEAILTDAFGGDVVYWTAYITDSVLARLFYVIRVDSDHPAVHLPDIEASISSLIQEWDDALGAALIEANGEERGVHQFNTYATGLPPTYRASFEPRVAVADIAKMEQLDPAGDLGLSVYREPGRAPEDFKAKLFCSGEPASLTDVMPVLTNLGLTVAEQRPYEIHPRGGPPNWVYDFSLQHQTTGLAFADLATLFEDAFSSAWSGETEDDGFNRLVFAAGLSARAVSVLRAYAKYLRQIGAPFGLVYLADTLVRHADVACSLMQLFDARFSPDGHDAESEAELSAFVLAAIDDIASLDEDRILRRLHNLIRATLRTNYYQRDGDGNPRAALAFKLDPTSIDGLPEPRPSFEIFVYSARTEGVHLRAGPVARGGLRWSDRPQDYRTEILGLVKAQMVKNAVIVPAGAKGGFVLKRPPSGDREAVLAEVEACYRVFISSLLDVTDNSVGGEIQPPPQTVRHDGDDPYLVVAADKGTAALSDVANEIALDRGFWLGDAFASGGSNGYDHKKMGITARGAWESVKRHFRELGHDTQTTDFTVAGIGDMSGDVFGNGMLLSEHIKLVAAFDHRHVFVDPDPDPAVSYKERTRLAELARSSWADYDESLLSPGGAVYSRRAKTITLSAEAQAVLGTNVPKMTPSELIKTVLGAPVDLLWNGGIGTYVKASDELHASVGDKANDAIRVDAKDLRSKVVVEGGNLGVTQLGRIEFAQHGGRIYTDAIDNSGGVDCSDHEVNIKILLQQVVGDGDMTAKQRNELLDAMTDEVTELVLDDNYASTQALSMADAQAAGMIEVHGRFIAVLESGGLLNRQLEYLPSADELVERRSERFGLTPPELAVLFAYAKNTLADTILASDVPDDPFLEATLVDYFPAPMRWRFGDRIRMHPLKREIVATRIANHVVDRAGTTMVYRLARETGAPEPEIARAHCIAWQGFALDRLWSDVRALDNVVSTDVQLSVLLEGRRLAERVARRLVRSRPTPLDSTRLLSELATPVEEVVDHLSSFMMGADVEAYDRQVAELEEAGVGDSLARRAAGLGTAIAALDIVDVATATGQSLDAVARIFFALADELDLTWLRDRIHDLPRDNEWATLARQSLRGELYDAHRELTRAVSGTAGEGQAPLERLDSWLERQAQLVDRYRTLLGELRSHGRADLTGLLVASRELGNLVR